MSGSRVGCYPFGRQRPGHKGNARVLKVVRPSRTRIEVFPRAPQRRESAGSWAPFLFRALAVLGMAAGAWLAGWLLWRFS